MEKFRDLSMPVLIFAVWILAAATAAAMSVAPRMPILVLPQVNISAPARHAHASR